MNRFKKFGRAGVSVVALAMVVGGGPVESDDVIQIAEAMLQSDGDDYIAARDRILAMPPDWIDRAVEHLQRDRDKPVAEMLGLALEFRAQHPDVAIEFQEEMRQMIDTPQLSRAGTLNYFPAVPRQPSDRDALYFESLFKYDLSDHAKRSIHGVLCNSNRHDHPVVVHGHLAVLYSSLPDQMKASSTLPLAQAAALHSDDRVVPALVGLYHHLRVIDAGSAPIPGAALGYLSGPEALLAVQQLLDFERLMAEQEGITPWDDSPYQALLQQTRDMQKESGEALRQARTEGRDLLPVKEEYNVRMQEMYQRMQARWRWEQLETSRDRIIENLSPPQ